MESKVTKKPVVLLDMDGVIADFIAKLLRVYNERWGATFTSADVTHYEFYECFPKEVAKRLYDIFNEPGFFRDLPLVDGAKEMVEKMLTFGCEVELCTSPSSAPLVKTGHYALNANCAKDKVEWVHEHFPELGNNITMTRRKQLLQADFLVDDSHGNIEKWVAAHQGNGSVGILVAQPWNEQLSLSYPLSTRRVQLRDVPAAIEVQTNLAH
jgi:5'(3')-deoxyribonucleotidase